VRLVPTIPHTITEKTEAEAKAEDGSYGNRFLGWTLGGTPSRLCLVENSGVVSVEYSGSAIIKLVAALYT
jgi:hypothetical protein